MVALTSHNTNSVLRSVRDAPRAELTPSVVFFAELLDLCELNSRERISLVASMPPTEDDTKLQKTLLGSRRKLTDAIEIE